MEPACPHAEVPGDEATGVRARRLHQLATRQPLFRRLAKHVQQKHVRFLDSRRRFTAHQQLDVRHSRAGCHRRGQALRSSSPRGSSPPRARAAHCASFRSSLGKSAHRPAGRKPPPAARRLLRIHSRSRLRSTCHHRSTDKSRDTPDAPRQTAQQTPSRNEPHPPRCRRSRKRGVCHPRPDTARWRPPPCAAAARVRGGIAACSMDSSIVEERRFEMSRISPAPARVIRTLLHRM